jgi:hypothetical protein
MALDDKYWTIGVTAYSNWVRTFKLFKPFNVLNELNRD